MVTIFITNIIITIIIIILIFFLFTLLLLLLLLLLLQILLLCQITVLLTLWSGCVNLLLLYMWVCTFMRIIHEITLLVKFCNFIYYSCNIHIVLIYVNRICITWINSATFVSLCDCLHNSCHTILSTLQMCKSWVNYAVNKRRPLITLNKQTQHFNCFVEYRDNVLRSSTCLVQTRS